MIEQPAPLQIRRLDPESEQARAFIAMSDEYMTALYPAQSNHLESIAALKASHVFLIGGYVAEELVACGAVKTLQDDGIYGEIKRVFVPPQHRGKGYSLRIMRELERHLRSCGVLVARLETGIRQPEALGLYRKLGYKERPAFGHYREDPLSVFMEKDLQA